MLTPDQWAAIQSAGTAFLLASALIAGMRGWYVWKREFDTLSEDRDYWRTVALEALGNVDRTLDVTTAVVKDSSVVSQNASVARPCRNRFRLPRSR